MTQTRFNIQPKWFTEPFRYKLTIFETSWDFTGTKTLREGMQNLLIVTALPMVSWYDVSPKSSEAEYLKPV